MSKTLLFCAVICLAVIPFTACDDGAGDAAYFVRFTLGGVTHELQAGFTEHASVPLGYLYTVKTNTAVYAFDSAISTNASSPPGKRFALVFAGDSPAIGEVFTLSVAIGVDMYQFVDGTVGVAVSGYGAVGGAISGTFTAMMTNNAVSAPAVALTGGEFRVLRRPDNIDLGD
jgi:hypothetical protein